MALQILHETKLKHVLYLSSSSSLRQHYFSGGIMTCCTGKIWDILHGSSRFLSVFVPLQWWSKHLVLTPTKKMPDAPLVQCAGLLLWHSLCLLVLAMWNSPPFHCRVAEWRSTSGFILSCKAHLCPEMNASIISEDFMFHRLHIWYNFVCFGGISLMRTLCDACYEEDESH